MREQNLQKAHDEYQSILHNPNRTQQALLLATWELQRAHWAIDQAKSREILVKAEKLALDIPTQDEKPGWWCDDSELGEQPTSRWLSEKGRVGIAKLIRDERRETWEWRIKVFTPILTILVSVLGLIVALITLLTRLSSSAAK